MVGNDSTMGWCFFFFRCFFCLFVWGIWFLFGEKNQGFFVWFLFFEGGGINRIDPKLAEPVFGWSSGLKWVLGIIQRTAIDSVFGESGPISTGGALQKGNIQSHDFMLKKSRKVLNPWDFSQRNTYTDISWVKMHGEKTRARSFWHQILIALWRMTPKKPRMSMFLGKADMYIQVCPPCRNYPTTSVVIYDLYIYILIDLFW